MIGTKHDLVLEVYPPTRTKRSSSISEECGADEIYVVSAKLIYIFKIWHKLFKLS